MLYASWQSSRGDILQLGKDKLPLNRWLFIFVVVEKNAYFCLYIWKVTTGASDDLEKVYKLSHAIITKYGMSERIGY